MNTISKTKGVRVSRAGNRLTIRWNRFSRLSGNFRSILGELLMFLIGLALFIPPASNYVPLILRQEWSAFQWTDLFSLLFLALGFLFLYRGLGWLVNTDVIQVTPETIKAWSFPLPSLAGAAQIPLPQVRKVESQIRFLSSRRSGTRLHSTTLNYDLVAVTYEDRPVILVRGSSVSETSIYVAREITHFLDDLRSARIPLEPREAPGQ